MSFWNIYYHKCFFPHVVVLIMQEEQDEQESTPRYSFKIVLVGPFAVGKTTLVRKYVEGKFDQDYLPTIGANVMIKQVTLTAGDRDVDVTLSIWDIAGQDTFKMMRPTFYAGASGAFLVSDLSRLQSFEEVLEWHKELREFLPESAPYIFLANKCDLEYTVDEAFIQETGSQVEALQVFKTSALDGTNVQEAFRLLAEKMMENHGYS